MHPTPPPDPPLPGDEEAWFHELSEIRDEELRRARLAMIADERLRQRLTDLLQAARCDTRYLDHAPPDLWEE